MHQRPGSEQRFVIQYFLKILVNTMGHKLLEPLSESKEDEKEIYIIIHGISI